MDITAISIGLLIGAIIGVTIGYFILKKLQRKQEKELLYKAKIQAENIKKDKIIQAKEKFLELKEQHEKTINNRERKIQEKEFHFKQRENNFNKKNDEFRKREIGIKEIEEKLEGQIDGVRKKEEELISSQKKQIEILEKVSGFSADEARDQLMETLQQEAKTKAMATLKEIKEEAVMNANKEAKKILIQTIQRVAAEQTIENAVSVFNIESDDIKGRLIG